MRANVAATSAEPRAAGRGLLRAGEFASARRQRGSIVVIDDLASEHTADDSATDAIGAVVKRLARPHASGGTVIERSVIIAEGERSTAILSWILDHRGVADSTAASGAARSGGLHGARMGAAGNDDGRARRFVLPADAFD